MKAISSKVSIPLFFVFLIVVLIMLLGIGVACKETRGYYLPIPMDIRCLAHRIISPEDLYEPIVQDRFRFWEQGYTKEYSLNPKYLDTYMVGICVEDGWLESSYKFQGKVKIEFYWKENMLYEEILTSNGYCFYYGNDMSKYRSVSLGTFYIPLQRKYAKNISMRVTVIEPDVTLERYNDSLNLYVSVGMFL